MKRSVLFACVALVLLLFTIPVLAQSTADLNVTVKDPKGAAVTNASVTVADPARGVERTVTQNTGGEYPVLRLAPGKYVVTVTAPGFAKTTATGVNVTIGQVAEMTVALRIAERTEAVEVSAETEQVETQNTAVSTTITEQRIDNLPINGRNYIDFTLTNSQTARDATPSIGAAPTSGLNIGGQRARANLVNVDGVDATDNSVNGIRTTVSQDAVQEFQIITTGYQAEYGRASGGVVNIITRSGTNDIHGTAFGFLRNRDFQAVNPFSTTPDPAYTRFQGGASIGGPIKKDKTFYFLSYEITRRQETGFSNIGNDSYGLGNTVDVSSLYGAPAGAFKIQATPQQAQFFSQVLPGLAVLPPPLVGALQKYAFLVGGSSGIAVNGRYPAAFAAITPPVPNQLAQFPTSCSATNLLCGGLPASFHSLASQAGNYPVSEGTTIIDARIDHKFTPNNSLTLRANVSPSTISGVQTQGQGQNFGQDAYSRTAYNQTRDFAITLADTATLGSNKINEFRFQYARRGVLFDYAQGTPFGGDVASNIVGYAFVGREPYSYVRRTEQRYQFADNFSIIKGKHNFKFGADINHLPLDAAFTVNFGGVYNFSNIPAAAFGFPTNIPGVTFPDFNPVQAYGLGVPNNLIQGLGNPNATFSNTPIGFFAQDSWRIKPNLTLNYGVRYDVEFLPGPVPLTPAAQAGYNALGITTAVPRDSNNVAPRIGIAWDPWNDGKTVVRASYGMFYDHPLLALQFLAQATDASATPQVLLAGGSPCTAGAPAGSPANLNATNTFQGILGAANCLPPGAAGAFGFVPSAQVFNPNSNSLFINQGFLGAGFPLGFMPFGFPNTNSFQYSYSDQANLSIEHDFGHNFDLSIAYNYNGGHHINRPINANAVRGDFLVSNWERAVSAALAAGVTPANPNFPSSPYFAGVENPAFPMYNPCGVVNGTQPYVPAPLVNFFRPSGLNPSMTGAFAPCVPLAAGLIDNYFPGLVNGTPAGAPGGVPFADMAANYANGSSVYHGLTLNLRKRFSEKYEFLASYTYSHAIDDSTDLESPLSPQDAYFPSAERSTSLFDQRHRFVFSGIYQSGRLSGSGFGSKFFSDWTVAPIIEIGSGRPFPILTAANTNYQFAPNSSRPNVVSPTAAVNPICANTVAPSALSPLGGFQQPCFADADVTAAIATLNPALIDGNGPGLQALDGNLGRNAGLKPYTLFNDLRIARRFHVTERFALDAMVDMFNLVNKNNVSDVNPLYTQAGQPTAAYDPRQFQFGLRLTF